MLPSPSPQPLDSLLAQAEGFAQFALRTHGKVPPALLALSPAGPLYFIPSGMADERAKDHFANTARLICAAHAVSAVVLVLEAWMTVAAPGRPLDRTTPPSESLYRKEVVILAGETRTTSTQKILPIIRTGAGGFFGFGESDAPALADFQGRFAQLLPPTPPTPATQAKIHALLAAMGITPASLRRDSSAN
jgi:hypothetical protein